MVMIKANEIRIGNRIRYSQHILRVIGLKVGGWVLTDEHIDGSLEEYDGIELSPSILRDCGFAKNEVQNGFEYIKEIGDDGFYFQFGFYKAAQEWTVFKICGNGCYDDGGEKNIDKICKSLHQLMNIYFSLTGEELIYSPSI
jgi:hypothetical protein